MGVTALTRDYDNGYRPEIVDWLLGNTGDWGKLTINARFAVEKRFSFASMMTVQRTNEFVITDGTTWSQFGFDVGDVIVWEFRWRLYDDSNVLVLTLPVSLTRNVTFLQGDTMTVDGASLADAPWNTYPFTSQQHKIDQVIVFADKKPEGAIITYGHFENDDADSFNLASFIDGTETRLAALNMHTMGLAFVPMDFMGHQSGMSINSANVKFVAKVGTHYYDYTFEIEFMLSSFFEDLTNFELQEAPSQVFDAASLTDNFLIEGYPEWNNPNTIMRSVMADTKRLGNTGWFNENFNGLDNNFIIKSMEYTDVLSALPVQRLSHGAETRVKARIGGVANMANGLTKSGLGFIWLPEEEDPYKNHETPFHQNLKVNTAGGYGIGIFPSSPIAGVTTYTGFSTDPLVTMDVKDVHFHEDAGDLIYEATFSPSVGFAAFVANLDEDDRNYALWISVADRTLVTNFSDRVNLLLDYNIMEIFIPPVGEWNPMVTTLYNHPQDGTGASMGCGANVFVEDDILAKTEFEVDITDVIPTGMQFTIEAVNPNTGVRYELQRFKVDLSGFPVNGSGVPQWNYDNIRGFKLETGNNKNWVKIERNASADNGNNYGYVAYFAYKNRWEHWLPRTGVPSAFFNGVPEEKNGFNNDWFHYLSTGGWELRYVIYTDAVKDGVNVRYINEETLNLLDYESNGYINETWTFKRESDGLVLNGGVDPVTGKNFGVILSNEPIRIEVLYERTDGGGWGSTNEVYGTICFEVDGGTGHFDFRQLSSHWGSEADNPLKPLAGETKLKLTLVSPTQIRMECLLNPAFIEQAVRYKFSSRIGCKNI